MKKSSYIFLFLAALLIPRFCFAEILKDNGTGVDGVMIFPRTLALRCGISSTDVTKEDSVKDCLNKLLVMSKGTQLGKEPYEEIFVNSYHEMNAEYFDIALNSKAAAGDAENQIDQLVAGDLDSISFKAITGGTTKLSSAALNVDLRPAASALGENVLRKKQKNFIDLSALGSKNMIDLLNVYNSQNAMDALLYYNSYEFGLEAAPVETEDDTEKAGEDAS